MGVGQGHYVYYIQEPGKSDRRAGEWNQPLTAVNGATPADPEVHRHGGFLYQNFRPGVLAIAVGVDPAMIPGFPAVGGEAFRDGCDDQAWEGDAAT